VNAAFLIMSSAALVGADPAPPPPGAPVVVNTGIGCGNCGAPSYGGCCGSYKPNLLDHLRDRFAKKHSCACAPACPAPKPAPALCNTCNTCQPTCQPSCANRPNLFDKLKSRWGTKKNCDAPCCDPCGGYHLSTTPPVTSTGPSTAPQEMPKPMDKPKEKPKGGNTSGLPQPLQATPFTGSGLTGNGSPY
jgi:hypothetical protein